VSSGVKTETLPLHQPVKINVYRPAKSFPSGLCLPQAAARIGLQIGDVEEVELDTSFFQGRSLSTPVAEQILSWSRVKERGANIGRRSIHLR
jgi:hypothetical protein